MLVFRMNESGDNRMLVFVVTATLLGDSCNTQEDHDRAQATIKGDTHCSNAARLPSAIPMIIQSSMDEYVPVNRGRCHSDGDNRSDFERLHACADHHLISDNPPVRPHAVVFLTCPIFVFEWSRFVSGQI